MRIYTKCCYCCNRAVQPRQKFYADPDGRTSYPMTELPDLTVAWNCWPWPVAGFVWRGGGGEEGSPAGHWPAGGTTSRQVINYYLRWKSQRIKIHRLRLDYWFLNPYPLGYGFLSQSPSFLFGNYKHLTEVLRLLVWFGRVMVFFPKVLAFFLKITNICQKSWDFWFGLVRVWFSFPKP